MSKKVTLTHSQRDAFRLLSGLKELLQLIDKHRPFVRSDAPDWSEADWANIAIAASEGLAFATNIDLDEEHWHLTDEGKMGLLEYADE